LQPGLEAQEPVNNDLFRPERPAQIAANFADKPLSFLERKIRMSWINDQAVLESGIGALIVNGLQFFNMTDRWFQSTVRQSLNTG